MNIPLPIIVFLVVFGFLSLPYSKTKGVVYIVIISVLFLALFAFTGIAWYFTSLKQPLSAVSFYWSSFLGGEIVTAYCFFTKTLIFEGFGTKPKDKSIGSDKT